MTTGLIIRSAIEFVFIVLLIIGFTNEDSVIRFEQKTKRDCKGIYNACKRQHIGLMLFLQIVFLAVVTPKNQIEQAKQKYLNRKVEN